MLPIKVTVTVSEIAAESTKSAYSHKGHKVNKEGDGAADSCQDCHVDCGDDCPLAHVPQGHGPLIVAREFDFKELVGWPGVDLQQQGSNIRVASG